MKAQAQRRRARDQLDNTSPRARGYTSSKQGSIRAVVSSMVAGFAAPACRCHYLTAALKTRKLGSPTHYATSEWSSPWMKVRSRATRSSIGSPAWADALHGPLTDSLPAPHVRDQRNVRLTDFRDSDFPFFSASPAGPSRSPQRDAGVVIARREGDCVSDAGNPNRARWRTGGGDGLGVVIGPPIVELAPAGDSPVTRQRACVQSPGRDRDDVGQIVRQTRSWSSPA
jgi:hypothetical protein